MTGGSYGEEGYVFQQYAPLAHFGGNFAVIGAWIVGDEPIRGVPEPRFAG